MDSKDKEAHVCRKLRAFFASGFRDTCSRAEVLLLGISKLKFYSVIMMLIYKFGVVV
jgi:hypothetical protein